MNPSSQPPSPPLVPRARWSPDCQGKWDYDGELLMISCRYWPSGGGFHVVRDGKFRLSTDPAIQPSATASILFKHGVMEDDDGGGEYFKLCEADFRGATEAEVKLQVEEWVAQKVNRISELLNGANL